MKRRMDCNYHLRRERVGSAFSAGLTALVIAGLLSFVSCSRMSLPPSAQEAPGTDPTNAASAPVQAQANSASSPVPAAPSPAAPVSIRAATADNVVAPPVLRPNAAAGAKEAAVKMYPALGVKDSTFNKTFRDLYVEKSQKDPEFLTRADWPLLLARQTADLLTVQPTAPAAPVAPPAITVASAGDGHTFKPTLAPNPLERGAYNRGYSHYWWNWNGRYYTYDPPNTPQPAPVTVASGGSGQAANPTPAPSALERGAYNQTRSHYYWWPWTRYYTP